MVPHSFLWHYLWLAPHVFQIVLAAIMVKRKLYRNFPWFLGYTIYQVLANGVMFVLDHSPAVSADSYHVAMDVYGVVSIVLRFGVIYEIFAVVLHPYESLKRLASLTGQFGLLALLLVAVGVAAFGPVADYTSRLISLYIAMDRAASIVQCGLLLLLFLFSSYFGISWRSFGFGIACGLGSYMTIQLALSAIGSHVPLPLTNTIDMFAYHLTVLVWLFYAWAPQTAGIAVKSVPQHQLESWNVELERLLQR